MEISLAIDVKGQEAIQRGFEKIAADLASGDLLARVGLLIERQAKLNASGRPGPNVQTNRLRSSITVWLSNDRPVTQAMVGTVVSYAPAVEYGHKQEVGRYVPVYGVRALKASVYPSGFSGRRRRAYEALGGFRLVKPFAPAYPFLGPALEQVQATGEMDGVIAEYANVLEQDWIE